MTEVKEKKTEEIKKEAEALKCPAQRSLYYIEEFLAGPMCGKCFPCEMGTYEAKELLKALVDARGKTADIAALKRIAENMLDSSRCKKGKDTAQYMIEWLSSEAFNEHVLGVCADKECKALIEFRIMPCTMCGLCLDACKYDAIAGEKKARYKSGYKPFDIRQKRCVKCGDCVSVCPEGAIVIVGKSEKKAAKRKEPVGAGK